MTLDRLDLRRAASALFVVLLHAFLILVILNATFRRTANVASPRELIMQFFEVPKPSQPQRALPPPAMIVPSAPRPNAITAPPPAEVPNGALQGLHQFLFDCAPENLSNLTPEERAQCGAQALGPNPDETNRLRNLPSRARDAPHWERALARKKAPLLLPCMHATGLPLSPDVVYCLGKAAATGSFGDLDEAPGYGNLPPPHIDSPHPGDAQVLDPGQPNLMPPHQ